MKNDIKLYKAKRVVLKQTRKRPSFNAIRPLMIYTKYHAISLCNTAKLILYTYFVILHF